MSTPKPGVVWACFVLSPGFRQRHAEQMPGHEPTLYMSIKPVLVLFHAMIAHGPFYEQCHGWSAKFPHPQRPVFAHRPLYFERL